MPNRDPTYMEIANVPLRFLVTAYSRFENAFSANPCATEVNSRPLRNLPAPKRFSKIFLTDGTKDDPPVKKTASTSRWLAPVASKIESTQRSICCGSSDIHSSKLLLSIL